MAATSDRYGPTSPTSDPLAVMGIFGRTRKPEHQAGVYVYLKKEDSPPYYSAVCRCGWFAEPVN